MTIDRSICGLLLFIVAYTLCIVVGEQHFIEVPPHYQEVSSGDNVHLRCTVHDKRGACLWQKDGRPVGTQQGKYEMSNHDGDCSLLIKGASLHFDDGIWLCQVLPSDYARQDALSSDPSQLLVMIKPREPRLEYAGGTVLGSVLQLREGEEVTISCVSKYGNPPALIKWYIGKTEVKPMGEQSNATEVDNKKTWAAHSLLRLRGRREYHGLPIRCVSVHPTNATPDSTEARLEIYYIPEVRVETSPLTGATEDSASFLTLKCLADANPKANIKWYKDSVPIDTLFADATTTSSPLSLTPAQQLNGSVWSAELRFEPVKRHDAGLYSCKAANSFGESTPASYRLDVQYEPEYKIDGNDTVMDVVEMALLGTAVEPFECSEFEANPPAQYKWVHLRGSLKENREHKGSGRRLRLENVTWSDEGEYRCIAYNVINGAKRETISTIHYVLHVTGPPEIQARPLSGDRNFYESIGWAGESVHRLKSRFCSRPPPKLVAWQWGSSHIRAGEKIDPKYEALPLEPIIENRMSTNCFWAKLEIKNLQKEDGRMYTLLLESEKGQDSTNIRLIVRDPKEMRLITTAMVIGLLFLLVLISAGVYLLLKMRRRRYRQRMKEDSSIAADALYSNGGSMDRPKTISSTHVKTFARKSNLDGSNVHNYNHIAKQTCAMSPEALKVRRAPAVLQPPTIV